MRRKTFALTFLAAVLFVAGLAFAVPQGTQQRACIDTMNGNSVRVGKAQAREIAQCIKHGGRGDLGALPLAGELETCFLADADNRVFTSTGKGLVKEQAKCEVN